MGYDFHFLPYQKVNATFPKEEFEPGGVLPWSTYRDWLLERGHIHRTKDTIWLDCESGGNIVFDGSADGISLDVHASPQEVLDAFEYLQKLQPLCCIWDPQTGVFHDAKSFSEFVQNEFV